MPRRRGKATRVAVWGVPFPSSLSLRRGTKFDQSSRQRGSSLEKDPSFQTRSTGVEAVGIGRHGQSRSSLYSMSSTAEIRDYHSPERIGQALGRPLPKPSS